MRNNCVVIVMAWLAAGAFGCAQRATVDVPIRIYPWCTAGVHQFQGLAASRDQFFLGHDVNPEDHQAKAFVSVDERNTDNEQRFQLNVEAYHTNDLQYDAANKSLLVIDALDDSWKPREGVWRLDAANPSTQKEPKVQHRVSGRVQLVSLDVKTHALWCWTQPPGDDATKTTLRVDSLDVPEEGEPAYSINLFGHAQGSFAAGGQWFLLMDRGGGAPSCIQRVELRGGHLEVTGSWPLLGEAERKLEPEGLATDGVDVFYLASTRCAPFTVAVIFKFRLSLDQLMNEPKIPPPGL